jgi:hypothetical protein
LNSKNNQLTQSEFLVEYRLQLLELQEALLKEEQTELPLIHDYAPGLYMRRIFMPKDTFVIGRTHKTEHFNIVMSGVAKVMIDGEMKLFDARNYPFVFKSGENIKKVLHILEDMIWATQHPTEKLTKERIAQIEASEEAEQAFIDEIGEEIICSKEEELKIIETELKRLS